MIVYYYEQMFYNYIERSNAMLTLEEVIELYLDADEDTKAFVEQLLIHSQHIPEEQGQHS